MKIYLLALFLILSSVDLSYAQNPGADTLAFNNRVSRMMNRWVVFPKATNSDKYPYGFVYMDQMAGFTFQLTGNFTIVNNKYVIDTAIQNKLKLHFAKYRLAPNTKLVALLPAKHYTDLGIAGDPDWVKLYNTYSDTLTYNVAIGRHLNSLNDCEYALTYLLKTYSVKPHAQGLEFELAYAYNVLKRFKDAISVLEPAIKNTPDDIFMYKELGYAYSGNSDLDRSITAYKDGIEHCGNQHPSEKLEMAYNLTMAYHSQKNDEQYKAWGQKTKEMAPASSPIYKQLVAMGF